MFRSAILALLCAGVSSPAVAQQVSDRVRTAAFIETVVQRGVECDLMQPWQAAALRALNQQDMRDWDDQRISETIAEVERQLEKTTTCTNDAMNMWIEGSRPGFDSEMLPPYLVAYRMLARMDDPPKVFSATTLRMDYAPAIAAIDAKFAELEESGATAEGGYSWPDYISRTEEAISVFVATLSEAGASGAEADEAASWLAQSALIVELWLQSVER